MQAMNIVILIVVAVLYVCLSAEGARKGKPLRATWGCSTDSGCIDACDSSCADYVDSLCYRGECYCQVLSYGGDHRRANPPLASRADKPKQQQ